MTDRYRSITALSIAAIVFASCGAYDLASPDSNATAPAIAQAADSAEAADAPTQDMRPSRTPSIS